MDNNTYIDQYYLGEPAVSYLIEIDDRKVLFDTAYSETFLKNAAAMNIDLHEITDIVLSHGHNDHSRGLIFLKEAINLADKRCIAHPLCFCPKHIEDLDIGSPYTAQEIADMCHYVPATTPYRISPHCLFLGEIPQSHEFEPPCAIGNTCIHGEEMKDFNRDDSAIVCETQQGIFIVTGCSHSGICNIISYAMKIYGCDHIAGLIGGFHLFEVDSRLKKTIRFLQQVTNGPIYPCHCVSLQAKAEMLKSLPVHEVGVGLKITMM